MAGSPGDAGARALPLQRAPQVRMAGSPRSAATLAPAMAGVVVSAAKSEEARTRAAKFSRQARLVARAPPARARASENSPAPASALAQQPARLDRHADALGHERMGLARGVARGERAPARERADAGTDRARGEPRGRRGAHPRAPRARRGTIPSRAAATASPAASPGCARAACPQRVAADATGEARAPAVAVHQAAIAAGKQHQRHPPRGQARIAEMRLESEQVARAMRSGARCVGSSPRSHEPWAATSTRARSSLRRALGVRDRHACSLRNPPRPRPRTTAARSRHRPRRPRSSNAVIEMLASHGAAPCDSAPAGRGHRRVDDRLAGVEADAPHRRPRGLEQLRRHAEARAATANWWRR